MLFHVRGIVPPLTVPADLDACCFLFIRVIDIGKKVHTHPVVCVQSAGKRRGPWVGAHVHLEEAVGPYDETQVRNRVTAWIDPPGQATFVPGTPLELKPGSVIIEQGAIRRKDSDPAQDCPCAYPPPAHIMEAHIIEV